MNEAKIEMKLKTVKKKRRKEVKWRRKTKD